MHFVLIRNTQPPEELTLRQVIQHMSGPLNISLPNIDSITEEQWPQFLELLADHSLYPLTVASTPSFDAEIEKLGAYHITQVNGAWTKQREVLPLTEQELAVISERKERQYDKDLLNTAGLALIRWQAGDATQQDFLDTVAAVKSLHGKA